MWRAVIASAPLPSTRWQLSHIHNEWRSIHESRHFQHNTRLSLLGSEIGLERASYLLGECCIMLKMQRYVLSCFAMYPCLKYHIRVEVIYRPATKLLLTSSLIAPYMSAGFISSQDTIHTKANWSNREPVLFLLRPCVKRQSDNRGRRSTNAIQHSVYIHFLFWY
jgi:hypothetical protein